MTRMPYGTFATDWGNYRKFPDGSYLFAINDSKLVQDGHNTTVVFTAQCFTKGHKHLSFTIPLPIVHPDMATCNAAYEQLGTLMAIFGLRQLGNTIEIHGKPFQAAFAPVQGVDGQKPICVRYAPATAKQRSKFA